jgi:2-oxoglutarate ferredoxin oxidoreductase subunit delta
MACPHQLVQISEQFSDKGYRSAAYVDLDGKCVGCANCATMCPDVAIAVYRTRRTRPGVERAAAARLQHSAGSTPPL